MRTCSQCNQLKAEDDFYPLKAAAREHRRECKECSRKRNKRYYIENADIVKTKTKKKVKINQEWNRRKILDYLLLHPCIDCGESDPIVLHFDHQKDKITDICNMMRHYISWSKLEKEIKKCEVRCANCHTRRTANQFQFWKVQMLDRPVI